MKRRWLLGTVAVGACLWMSGTAGLEGAKPPAAVPLVVAISNVAGYGLADDAGLYTNGAENVEALLLSNDFGNFIFDTNATNGGATRHVRLNFGGQIGVPAELPSNGWFDADIFLGTLGVAGNVSADGNLRTMVPGTDLQRRTRIGWEQGGVQYSLRWDTAGDDGVLNFSCTGYQSACNEWTVTPKIYSTGAKAALYTISTVKGTTTETPKGSFTMPFSMTLTRK